MAIDRLVVLCAIPGTGLSSVTAKLAKHLGDQVHLADVEDILCQGLNVAERGSIGLPSNGTARMVNVVSLPRSTLYEKWKDAAERALSFLDSDRPDASVKLLSLHLTWYNASTNEFFSPVELEVLKQISANEVLVVNIFDDIYDTYDRLSASADDLFHHARLATQAKMLEPIRYGTAEVDTAATEQLILETRISALTSIMSWRRSETVLAEMLARQLGGSFHPFAVKHSISALGNLIMGDSAGPIYLSHKISDPRRANKASASLPHDLGDWPPNTYEANTLHLEMANCGRVLINPTAIDELRFESSQARDSRSPFLASRWPLVSGGDEGALCWSKSPSGPEFTRLLEMPALAPGDSAYSSAVGNLENRIYFEIPFRDHIIVVNTPNLLVYRPFVGDKPEWSGGVGPEVLNWRNSAVASDRPRRALFVHSRSEIEARIKWLFDSADEHRFKRKVCDAVIGHLRSKMLEAGIPSEQVADFFNGKTPASGTHLLQYPINHLENRRDEISGWFRSFCLAALEAIFTSVERPHEESPYSVALMVVSTDDSGALLNTTSSAQQMSEYFCGQTDPYVLTEEFWETAETVFTEVTGASPIQKVLEEVGLNIQSMNHRARTAV